MTLMSGLLYGAVSVMSVFRTIRRYSASGVDLYSSDRQSEGVLVLRCNSNFMLPPVAALCSVIREQKVWARSWSNDVLKVLLAALYRNRETGITSLCSVRLPCLERRCTGGLRPPSFNGGEKTPFMT